MNEWTWGVAHVFARESVGAEHPATRGLPLSRRRRICRCSVPGLFRRSQLVDAANRHCESGIGRISATTQDRRALCRFAVGASSPIGSVAADTCSSRTGARARKEQRRRAAEERDQGARGAHKSPPSAARSRATKSVLGRGLGFVPVIRFSPLVLISVSPKS